MLRVIPCRWSVREKERERDLVCSSLRPFISKYRYALHNDVSVNDGQRIRQWSRNIILYYIIL
jgi:hypothetical protein